MILVSLSISFFASVVVGIQAFNLQIHSNHLNTYFPELNSGSIGSKTDFIQAIQEKGSPLNSTQNKLIEVFDDDENFTILQVIIARVFNNELEFGTVEVKYDNKKLMESSFGQRCTAAIVILLYLGNNPIIIDEPEAHLDSGLIANYLVNLVKERKQNRQIIFATHNANFVINGDAELILVLENEDGITSIKPTTIENDETKDDLLRLEGSKEAFQIRRGKYNLSL